MTCPDGIRRATLRDVPALLDLLRLEHAESGFGRFSPERTLAAIGRGIDNDFATIGIIHGNKEPIEASIGLFIGGFWNSSTQNLHDLWCFVHPNHRKTKHAQLLVDFAKWAAAELNRPLLMTARSTLQFQTERQV